MARAVSANTRLCPKTRCALDVRGAGAARCRRASSRSAARASARRSSSGESRRRGDRRCRRAAIASSWSREALAARARSPSSAPTVGAAARAAIVLRELRAAVRNRRARPSNRRERRATRVEQSRTERRGVGRVAAVPRRPASMASRELGGLLARPRRGVLGTPRRRRARTLRERRACRGGRPAGNTCRRRTASAVGRRGRRSAASRRFGP